MVPMRPVPVSDSVKRDSMVDKSCAACFVHGQSHRGSFEYAVDCYQVTCYCDCSGWLRCSVQPAMTPECPPQYGPVSGRGCRSCVVRSHEYPPSLQFALRVGCYGYDCTCGCDGLWMCPTQQPSNYCVRPASPPTGGGGVAAEEDRYDVLASEGGPGGTAELRGRGGTAGLTDSTFSRTAGEEEEEETSSLRCLDCDVRGTTYPSRSRFLLRNECRQDTCYCACDGSWACPKNATVDVCQQEREEEEEEERRREQGEPAGEPGEPGERGGEEEVMREKAERALAEVAAHSARMAGTYGSQSCQSCHVNGKHYLTNTDFQLRQGCRLDTCRCFCNGSWDCPASRTRNLCAASADYRGGGNGCRQCHLNNKTHQGGSAFAYTEGCWEFYCRGGCNGEGACPPEDSRDLCNAAGGGSVPARQTPDGPGEMSLPARCKPCMVDGQVIR